MDELLEGVREGVFMETNRSWSIDDRRLKFQFGTEVGRLLGSERPLLGCLGQLGSRFFVANAGRQWCCRGGRLERGL